MRANLFLIGLVALGASACGASDGGKTQEREERELHTMHGTLGAFHDVLAPVFHMEKGSERDAKACGSVPDFETRATNVVKDLRSEKDPAFKAAAEALKAKVGELDAACGEHEGVADKLGAVHDAFHAALEAAHEGEGEGEHGRHDGDHHDEPHGSEMHEH